MRCDRTPRWGDGRRRLVGRERGHDDVEPLVGGLAGGDRRDESLGPQADRPTAQHTEQEGEHTDGEHTTSQPHPGHDNRLAALDRRLAALPCRERP